MEKRISTPKIKKKKISCLSFSPSPKKPLMPINPNLIYRENIELNHSMSPNFQKLRIKKKLEWTEEENENIKNFVKEFGTKKWKQLSELYPGKTPKQYREHYHNCLETNILKKIDFNPSEDEIILKYVQENGRKFAKLSKMMPGRTETSIKNRYYFLLKKNLKNEEHFNDPQNNSSIQNSVEMNVADEMQIVENENNLNQIKIEENQFENDIPPFFIFDPFDNFDPM